MNPGQWISGKVVAADALAERGSPWEGCNLLVEAVRPMPRRHGAADAMAIRAKIYFQTSQAYPGELACLEALRWAPSFIEADLLFDTLVNLNSFNLLLKSYDEAYAYGRMAEAIRSDDSDLGANMVVAAAMTSCEEEALSRFERLKQLAPMKAAVIKRYFEGEGPSMDVVTSTRHVDCSDILQRLRTAVTAGSGDEVVALVAELQQRPEGIGARDCWLELCRFHRQTVEIADDDEYLLIQGYAGLASATGKAINAAPGEAEGDGRLWRWRGEAFTQLRLFELAIPALERATALAPEDAALSQSLSECRVMLDLWRGHTGRADELLLRARTLARRSDRFWEAFDLFQESFFLSKRSLEQRVQQSQDLHDRGFGLFHADRTEAIGLLCEAAANHPEVPHTWQELGSLHSSLSRFREAERFQRYAVELVRSMSPLPSDAGRFWANLANCRLNRALSDVTLSPARREMKVQQAAADARQALAFGDHRAQAVLDRISTLRQPLTSPPRSSGHGCGHAVEMLQRELMRKGQRGSGRKRWWRFW